MASNPRPQILKNRSDFLYILKNGHRARPCDWLTMNFIVNRDGVMRCGWTLPRQVGSAVVRNRLKRWSRVYFRNLLKESRTLPVDVNLVFRKTENDFYKKLDYEGFSKILDMGWRQVKRRIEASSSVVDRNVQSGGKHPSGRRLPV